MPTLTIRNLPERTIQRLKERARSHHRSMEQEVRDILEQNVRDRKDALERIEARWANTPAPMRKEVDQWLAEARSRTGVDRLQPTTAAKATKTRGKA